MKLPIIANSHGDILVFGSIDYAQRYMEPIDVLNNEYDIYDSEAFSLRANVVKQGKRERVILEKVEPPVQNLQEVERILRRFLTAVLNPVPLIPALSLDELVEMARRYEMK
jgi:hypothetical protein